MAELWYKGHPKYALDPRLRLIALDTGRQEDSIRGIYWTLIALASQESPRGKLPKDVSGSLAVIMGADAAAADAVLESFKAHGIVNRHRHISWWSAEQLLPSEEKKQTAARERCKRYRAKKAGKPVEAPAPEPKAEPKPEPEPAPKPKTVQLSLDGTPVEKPAAKEKKPKTVQGEPEEFTRFYRLYPRHVGRRDALKAWNSVVKTSEHAEKAIAYAHRLGRWNDAETESMGYDGEMRFCPHPATALRKGYWEDEVDLVSVRRTAAGCGFWGADADCDAIDVQVVEPSAPQIGFAASSSFNG